MFSSAVVLVATVLALASGVLGHGVDHIVYSTVMGYFLQDLNSTNATTFDYVHTSTFQSQRTTLTLPQTATNFGLINRTYPTDHGFDPHGRKTQWQRFAHFVSSLNAHSGPNTQYKVLFMGRHGEGYHNAAQTYYGTPAWNCYWSERDGNATATWADAHLTPNGIAQAQIAHNFWARELATQKIPAPESYYTSPLYRCLQTANVTFSGLRLLRQSPFVPLVKELFRESISGHTCDRRSNRTFIADSFPTYRIEKGFSEQDLLWKPLVGETAVDQQIRSKTVLDQVFGTDRNTWISITSHSGEIGAILVGECSRAQGCIVSG